MEQKIEKLSTRPSQKKKKTKLTVPKYLQDLSA